MKGSEEGKDKLKKMLLRTGEISQKTEIDCTLVLCIHFLTSLSKHSEYGSK